VGTVNIPPPVRFFASVIFCDSGILSTVEAELSRVAGPIGERTGVAPFSQSNYYCPEMGETLLRYFLFFAPLRGRDTLAEMKLETNRIEALHSVDGRRLVNIDPGYVALEQMVLATTKGFAHRIYLSGGIFADLTLAFENGTYHGLPWTYPDYGSQEFVSLLNRWREDYKRELRCQRV
jgi:hypothetical protein